MNQLLVAIIANVDDLLIMSKISSHVEKVKEELAAIFETTDLSALRQLLAVKFHRLDDLTGFILPQKAYAERILCRFEMGNCKPAGTPIS